MKSRELLIYCAVVCKGDWNKIYDLIMMKDKINEEYAKKRIRNLRSKVVTILDDDYPEQLKHVRKPPFVLFYHGDISLAKNKEKLVSVVGARKYSEYGEECTNKLVGELCKEVGIVSGMALGIDGIAHRACMQNGGKTICVLGGGINTCYPSDNLDIYKEACKNHLVLSEYPDKTPSSSKNFPIRNRIVAALSNCLLIVEGKKLSGTSITATIALECGGNVCCVPTRIGEDSICNYLISNGAALVETVDDIFLEMNYRKLEPIF